MRPVVTSLVGAFAVIWSTAAGADATTATSALSWVRLPGAEGCVSTQELGARIETHLGRSVLVSPSVADISIEGRIVASGAGAATRFRATVGGTRRDGTPIGSRELVSPSTDCRALDDGLVLVLALMIDPNALEPARREPASGEPEPRPSEPVTREVVHERLVVREVERPSPSPWMVQASLTGLVAIERLPGMAPGAGLVLRAGPSRLVAFEVSLGLLPAATLMADGRAVDLTLFEGGLAFCPTVALGPRIDAIGCAGMRVGAIRTRGRDFAKNAEVDRGLADVALGPRLVVTIAGPLFALASATALVPLVRQATTATRGDGETVTLDERSFLGAELGLGLGLRFSP